MKMLRCPLCGGKQYFLWEVLDRKTQKHLYCCILCQLNNRYKLLKKYIPKGDSSETLETGNSRQRPSLPRLWNKRF